MADKITLIVPEELDGERLDRVVAMMLETSRAVSRALFEKGVEVEGSSAKPSDRVPAGTRVVTPRPSEEEHLQPEEIDFGTVYEDGSVLVVDKPPGLVVHPGSGRTKGTLAAGLLFRYPDIEGVGKPGRWGLVHRLDRDTSGLIVVARTADAHQSLTEQLARREISRDVRNSAGTPGHELAVAEEQGARMARGRISDLSSAPSKE